MLPSKSLPEIQVSVRWSHRGLKENSMKRCVIGPVICCAVYITHYYGAHCKRHAHAPTVRTIFLPIFSLFLNSEENRRLVFFFLWELNTQLILSNFFSQFYDDNNETSLRSIFQRIFYFASIAWSVNKVQTIFNIHQYTYDIIRVILLDFSCSYNADLQPPLLFHRINGTTNNDGQPQPPMQCIPLWLEWFYSFRRGLVPSEMRKGRC